MAIRIGEVDTIRRSKESDIEWRIANFLSVVDAYDESGRVSYRSPSSTVADMSFYFDLYPRNRCHPESACVYLNKDTDVSQIEYFFCLKRVDGVEEYLCGGIMEKFSICRQMKTRLVVSEILRRKTELLHNNALIIIFTLRKEIMYPNKTAEMTKLKAMELINLEKLSENFRELLNDQESCDVTLKVNGKEFKAHRSVLIARSKVFAANFKHDTLERQTEVISIPDCDSDSFALFLEYLYCGKLKELSVSTALNLYCTSDKYDVQELKSFCADYLEQCLDVKNVCEVAILADEYNAVDLFSAVQEFFNQNFCGISECPEWKCLMKKDCRLANKLLKGMAEIKQGK